MIDCSKCPDRGACCGIIPMSKESIKKESFQVKPKEILTILNGCVEVVT